MQLTAARLLAPASCHPLACLSTPIWLPADTQCVRAHMVLVAAVQGMSPDAPAVAEALLVLLSGAAPDGPATVVQLLRCLARDPAHADPLREAFRHTADELEATFADAGSAAAAAEAVLRGDTGGHLSSAHLLTIAVALRQSVSMCAWPTCSAPAGLASSLPTVPSSPPAGFRPSARPCPHPHLQYGRPARDVQPVRHAAPLPGALACSSCRECVSAPAATAAPAPALCPALPAPHSSYKPQFPPLCHSAIHPVQYTKYGAAITSKDPDLDAELAEQREDPVRLLCMQCALLRPAAAALGGCCFLMCSAAPAALPRAGCIAPEQTCRALEATTPRMCHAPPQWVKSGAPVPSPVFIDLLVKLLSNAVRPPMH